MLKDILCKSVITTTHVSFTIWVWLKEACIHVEHYISAEWLRRDSQDKLEEVYIINGNSLRHPQDKQKLMGDQNT